MLKALFLALNVRADEQRPVLLLLGKGFFMGIFLATFQVSAETLFLSRMIEYLKEGILVSGALGVFFTFLFAFFQSRVKFSYLAMANLLIIFGFTLTIYLFFQGSDPQLQNYLTFIIFAMIGPILAVVLLGFWGTFGRLFDLRQSKRIIGRIDIGQLLAAIGTYFAIPFFKDVIPDTSSYLLISAISVFISFLFLLIIEKTTVSKGAIKNTREDRKQTGYVKLTKNNYVRQLSYFLFFSMITFTFIQYSFQTVVAQQFPAEDTLRNFVAVINGSILILGLFMQSFVNDRVITEYGLKVALLILPVIVGVFTLAAIGTAWLFGYTPDSDTFTYFFMFIALSRLFNFSIRDSLENPTFKLYFMPFDLNIRFNIQTKVEGVVNEFSRFIGGVLIVGLSALPFIDLLDYSYAVVILLIGYFVVAAKMYQGYRNMIRIKLERQQEEIAPEKTMSLTEQLVIRLNRFLRNSLASYSIFSFRLLEKVQPQVIPHSINMLMRHEENEVKAFAQSKMNEVRGTSVSDRYILRVGKIDPSRTVISREELLELFKSGEISRTRVYSLSKSSKPEDRQYAAEIIGNYSDDERTHYLVDLLYDRDIKVRNTAIKTAQKKYNCEVLNALIDNLNDPTYSIMASNVLTAIGEPALKALEHTFYSSKINNTLAQKLVQILGRIGGEEVRELLWNKLDFPNKIVVSEVLRALGGGGYQAGLTQIPRIKYAIESDIEAIAWNMAAYYEVSDTHFGKNIRQALEEEVNHDIRHIYMLLSMLYDGRSIQLVKENIESGTHEGMTYAIELLDVFLSDELKKKIIPVLDETTYKEKAVRLEEFYPRQPLDDNMVLRFLLNRDFSQTNRWTRACVIYQMGMKKLTEFQNDLIAHFFNPDLMIKEVAAWAIYNMDSKLYEKHVKRLPENEQFYLNRLMDNLGNNNEYILLFLRIHFLRSSSMFHEVEGVVLAEMADMLENKTLTSRENLTAAEDFYENFYIVYQGSIQIFKNDELLTELKEGIFIGESLASSEYRKELIAGKDGAVLFQINKDLFYAWLSENVSLANQLASQWQEQVDE
jgi:HEAT repeat protein